MATFILVHGASHGGWCWEKVKPILEGHGHKVCTPDLPGLGKDQTPPASVTLADNVERISRLLDKMEEPVILVGHALGGVTISQVAEARRRKIKALVYVCGLMPPSGKTSREMTGDDPDALFRRSRELSPDGLTYTFARAQLPVLFYADVSPEDRYRAMERLRPQPISISTTPVSLTDDRFGSVPRWYIECTQDNAVRIARQRTMVKTLPCKVITMECGHTPFYSKPEELAEHLEEIARS
ncbi:Pimeloyl-ACP methyl ester carboxylesterase [Enhydrobacter aerosaccus]|uniref:Pimeloyl-ACP methyl ester carboxylesterase n=1 Tax=Enhydrobacter aerosaccus TaxID=225324 RepID=A0A1T4RY45_9HYPH|nr:alpha/beta fold hydrolase [Enhydrobacter aerosaccus]SKA20893.1 Pimeloyl-ACP methyl ester carboxylesterase [Enhydrobacter aerosaccus]